MKMKIYSDGKKNAEYVGKPKEIKKLMSFMAETSKPYDFQLPKDWFKGLDLKWGDPNEQ